MGKEYRVYGPPGTGKTTWLTEQISNAADSRGPENVMVTSFTKAAATELVKRNLPIPKENVGTLHALFYHALDRPTIAESKIEEWNEYAPPPFHLSVKRDAHALDDPLAESAIDAQGDDIMRRYQLVRNKLTPRELWPSDVQLFDQKWVEWKESTGYEDFTGMLERARTFYAAPGEPEVIFLDESQDCVPLQWAILRKWAQKCDTLVCSGDDDQVLYSWVGASADLMLDPPVPEDQTRVLRQSYRVPQEVLDLSQKWISGIKKRWPKEYKARLDEEKKPAKGSVKRVACCWRIGDSVLPVVENALKQNHSIMILASCGYMLQPILSSLRAHGIPFQNQYRRAQGAWNPLYGGRGVSVKDRVLSFLRPQVETWGTEARWWSWDDMKKWADMLKVKEVFQKGGQTRIDALAKEHEGEPVNINILGEIFTEQALDRMMEYDLDWLRKNLLATRAKSIDFPLNIIKKSGGTALREEPRCTVGTIHCSPADEPVLTVLGWIPIGELNSFWHRLVGYNPGAQKVVSGSRKKPFHRNGFPFIIAKNPYRGPLLTLTTEQSRTRVTPTHRLDVRWAESFYNKWLVYLMRRGNWWRIGLSASSHLGVGVSVGLGTRLSKEKADAGWILGIYESRHDALVAEATIQGLYGIPGLTFESNSRERALSADDMHTVYDAVQERVALRVTNLFTDYGLDPEYPLHRRDNTVRCGYAFETAACNIIPGYMEVATVKEFAEPNSSPTWLPVQVTNAPFEGDVYSLSVPPHEHYISGGTVVHNSVKGGESDEVLVFPDLSRQGLQQWLFGGEGRDAIRRMFYVAQTRTKEVLHLAQPSIGGMAVDWNG